MANSSAPRTLYYKIWDDHVVDTGLDHGGHIRQHTGAFVAGDGQGAQFFTLNGT